MRMLSVSQREQYKNKREELIKIIEHFEYKDIRVLSYFESKGYIVERNQRGYIVYGKDIVFNLTKRGRDKVTLGRTCTMRVSVSKDDVETLYSIENMPYRFENFDGKAVIVRNYDWSKYLD